MRSSEPIRERVAIQHPVSFCNASVFHNRGLKSIRKRSCSEQGVLFLTVNYYIEKKHSYGVTADKG